MSLDGSGLEQELGGLLTTLPDLDGDGVQELLCRAFRVGGGSLLTVSGKTGSVLEDRSIGMGEFLRSAVEVSDLDGDGIREIAIGSASAPWAAGVGEVILLSPPTWEQVGRLTRADCMDGLRPIR